MERSHLGGPEGPPLRRLRTEVAPKRSAYNAHDTRRRSSSSEDPAMTRYTTLAVLALFAIASSSVLAQGDRQSPAEFRRMLDKGIKYRTAFELYSALKTEAGGGRQSPPYSQLPDWSGLWIAAGGGSLF